MNLVVTWFLTILIMLVSQVEAQVFRRQSSAKTTTVAKINANTNAVATSSKANTVSKKNRDETKEYGLTLSTSLSTRTDLADEKPTRIYTNSFGLNTGYSNEVYSIGLGTSYSYTSVNTDVVDQKYSVDGMSDSTLDVGFFEWLSTSATIPTSSTSQYEGIKGALSLGASYSHDLGKDSPVSFSHGLGYEYLFNTYEYSPITNKPTRQMSVSYSVGCSLSVFGSNSIGLGAGVQSERLNDGSIEIGSSVNSNFRLGYTYKFKKMNFGVVYNSGNFFDDKFQNNWFMNQYQQVIYLRVGYQWL